jgi:hypothetical protein
LFISVLSQISSLRRECWDSINWFNQTHICVRPKTVTGFPMPYVMVFFVFKWFEVRGDSSFCWYWWNCWPLLFKLSFHICIIFIIYQFNCPFTALI